MSDDERVPRYLRATTPPTPTKTIRIHYPGERAFYDSFSGLVPVTVVDVEMYVGGGFSGEVRMLSLRVEDSSVPTYPKGWVWNTSNVQAVVPRLNVRRRLTNPRIVGEWTWRPLGWIPNPDGRTNT